MPNAHGDLRLIKSRQAVRSSRQVEQIEIRRRVIGERLLQCLKPVQGKTAEPVQQEILYVYGSELQSRHPDGYRSQDQDRNPQPGLPPGRDRFSLNAAFHWNTGHEAGFSRVSVNQVPALSLVCNTRWKARNRSPRCSKPLSPSSARHK